MSRRILSPLLVAVVIVAACAPSGSEAQGGAGRGRRAGPPPDSMRITIMGSKLRYLPVGDETEQAECTSRGVGETGTERITSWATKQPDGSIPTFTEKTTLSNDLEEQTVRDSATRETEMPICSYKRAGGSSQYCKMQLTGKQRGEVTIKELNDAEHGRHLLVAWRLTDPPVVSVKVDAGSCLRTRNEQEDGDLTYAMAEDFERQYRTQAPMEGPDAIVGVAPLVFPLAKAGWFRKPVPLKSADGTWTLEVGASGAAAPARPRP